MPSAKRSTTRGPGDSIWIREADPAPSRARALNREAIVATAIAIADREGLASVSIRRIAAELNARPMSLYAHFETKEDLLELMHDAAAEGALVTEGELPSDWRQALRTIARQTRATTLQHPWLVATLGRRTRLGPATLRHLDQSLAAVSTLDADDAMRQAVIAAVDTFTLGHVQAQITGELAHGATGAGSRDAVGRYVQTQLASGDLPHLAQTGIEQLLRDDDPDASFERGLDWVLAGAAAALG